MNGKASLNAVVEAAFAPVAEAVSGGAIPGAALGVTTPDGARAVKVAGRAAVEPDPITLRRTDWFDLASLTKVMFTTTEVLKLVEAGRVALDDPLSRHIPDFYQYQPEAPLRQITLRALLTHASGLPPVVPLYTWGHDPETLRAFILQHDWPLGPPAYSDIGFMLLGIMLERLLGCPLKEVPVAEGLTFAPDFMESVSTERCSWRGRMMRGAVHDENAFALGGVAGHAGLFGQIDGVLAFSRDLMNGAVLGPEITAEMIRRQTPARGLGWQLPREDDVPGEPDWAGGTRCSPRTIGHTGFTGTGLWIDLDGGYAWALLTNRVHPSRHVETGIGALRRAVGDLVAGAFAGA